MARKGRSGMDLFKHVEPPAGRGVAPHRQLKIVAALGEKPRAPAKFLLCSRVHRPGARRRSGVLSHGLGKTGKPKHFVRIQALDFLEQAFQPSEVTVRFVGGNVEIDPQRQFSGPRQLGQDSAVRESHRARLHIAD